MTESKVDVHDVRQRLLALIPELEYSRETHVQWRDCDQSCRDANPQIGSAEFHAGAVNAYDERIAAIGQASAALSAVAELIEAATELRQRQRDYLSGPKGERSEEKGRLVGVAASRVDAALAACTPAKSEGR